MPQGGPGTCGGATETRRARTRVRFQKPGAHTRCHVGALWAALETRRLRPHCTCTRTPCSPVRIARRAVPCPLFCVAPARGVPWCTRTPHLVHARLGVVLLLGLPVLQSHTLVPSLCLEEEAQARRLVRRICALHGAGVAAALAQSRPALLAGSCSRELRGAGLSAVSQARCLPGAATHTAPHARARQALSSYY